MTDHWDAQGRLYHQDEPDETECEVCGAIPSYLYDDTPLDERGTWLRLCGPCMAERANEEPTGRCAVHEFRPTYGDAAFCDWCRADAAAARRAEKAGG